MNSRSQNKFYLGYPEQMLKIINLKKLEYLKYGYLLNL